ncbi:MAG: hypothetical protein ACO23R_02585 [bacterium]
MSNNNENRGGLWKAKEQKTDKHPNLTGKATIDGVEYFVAGWSNRDGGNKPVVSLSFTRKDGQPAKAGNVDDIEDLPF